MHRGWVNDRFDVLLFLLWETYLLLWVGFGPCVCCSYLPGSIVRVKLRNFVTYDQVEFCPGPYLNMIIGPNGTGKSTISCAIALCLGYKPSLLGRATDVSAFVKQGHTEGYTELELKGFPGGKNVVIRRRISTEKLSSSKIFFLNGQAATAKHVAELMMKMHIQIDNLCSFLPQDKVTEFARMTPNKLLIETEKASTEGDLLIQRHSRLIEHSKSLRSLLGDLRRQKEELAAITAQTSRLQSDADRHQRRQLLEERKAVLQAALKYAKYAVALKRLKGYEKHRSKLYARVTSWDKQNRPFEEAREKASEHVTKAALHFDKAEGERVKMAKQIRKLQDDYDKTDRQREKFERDLENLAESDRRRYGRIQSLKETIRELEERTAEPPPAMDMTHVQQTRQRIDGEISAQRREESDATAEMGQVQVANKRSNQAREHVRAQMEKLQNQKNVKMSHLRDSDAHTFQAVCWLEEHRHLFKGRVHPPPLLEVEIDQRYRHLCNSIEMPIRWATLKTFVCEKRADYDLIARKLNDEMQLRVNVAEIENVSSEEIRRQMPVDPSALRQMGFDGYVVDFLRGPQTVLNYLCVADNLHQIPLTSTEQRLDRARVERQFRRFIVGDTMNLIRVSPYAGASGKHQVQMSTRVATPARNLVHNVDTEQLRRLEREEAERAEEKRSLETRFRELQARLAGVQETIGRLKGERETCNRERDKAVSIKRGYEQALLELDSKRRDLQKELEAPSIEGQRSQIQRRLRALTERLAHVTQDLAFRMTVSLALQETSTESKLRLVQAEADLSHLEGICQEIQADAQELKREVQETQARLREAKAQAKHLFQEAQRGMGELDRRLEGELRALSESDEGQFPSVEDLQQQLLEVQIDLDGAPSVSADVLRRYREKLAMQEELEARVQGQETLRARLQHKVDKYRQAWEPQLVSLIERVNDRFADAFDQFQCTGEVRLAKPLSAASASAPASDPASTSASAEDAALAFEEYTVEIRVKFRQEEELQLLTAERQSGGERSLSTILYLMSLTELSAAPFSLVDEINQGMDQRAERLVHDHMVRTTCRQAAGQYFLITPKLLAGLQYDEKMRLLIINAGDYVPERFSFRDYLRRPPAPAAPAAPAAVAA